LLAKKKERARNSTTTIPNNLKFTIMAQISGRLTRDAQIKTGKHDKEFVSFTVVENYDYKNKKGEWVKKSTFFNCTYGRSTKVASLLTKGTFVILAGEISIREYTRQEGEKKAALQLRVTDLKIPTGSAKSTEKKSQPKTQTEEVTVPADDLPF